ncbi:tetratricopeptide repeat protein [Brasilonema bromeliae]|uniref:Tfp pilus assembly protein PilF n=1 Tax=Brasilonema bromeliae SPC951 TaxID=385972 RepID=A0ABX1P827_9CYAN|nr:tetratricopeptide repeat protein [Brasilonema bromeliae]NMG20577.1 Tfp pilus assembly protein PilF [Brasilonema bromeliae SPC951]
MPVITIREEEKTDTGFEVTLRFEEEEYLVTIANPFTSKEETELEWYFEEWLEFPFSDTAIAQRAAASIKKYGQNLFNQVFTDRDAYSQYQRLGKGHNPLQIEIVGKTPDFQALHWEALWEPGYPQPLAVDCVMVRKSVKRAGKRADVPQSPVINLLVVIARPNEEQDVGYRTISRSLIEAIENSQLAVNVELLRPGTYEALAKHLEEKGPGFYHIIHFDTHGALMKYNDIQKETANPYAYQLRWGRYDLQPYEGVKAFVFLEGETKGDADPVEATELANLLMGKGIPVCLLNACQSGKQVKMEDAENDYRETSLGSQLMAAGMQMVVAMGYTVMVDAAKLMMQQVYAHLFDHKDISEAIRLGRLELFNDKKRKAYFNKHIDLEDWLLPVVYSNQAVKFNLREFTPQEEEEFWQTEGERYRFTSPEYGFFGRDLEILKIEKSLLRHNILLLQGMGGTGKTTLLKYLRQWWQRTCFAKDIFYFGYDHKAWTLTQILFEIGTRVYKRNELANFQTMNQTVQVPKLVAKLRAESYILILDNLESVTGQPLAIQNTLPETERNQIKDFLTRLVGGRTRVILGSRSREDWLQATTFKNNIYELQGLDKEARSDLAQAILQSHVTAKRILAIRQDEDFQKLMQLLAGYPLAMEVVLANLKNQSPKEILSALQSADVKLDTGNEEKTKSILKCVEYSHSNLSPEAQKLLLCLAPFSGFINRRDIPNYIKKLQTQEPFKDYHFEKFDEAIQEAINWGLLSPMNLTPSPSPTRRGGEEDLPFLAIQPVFPYFLKTKLETLDEETREALQSGFKNHYEGGANFYNQLMESKEAQERQLGIDFCRLEYENLYNALQICLDKQENISIYFCLNKYFEFINDNQSNLKLAEMVCQRLQKYPQVFIEGELGYQIPFAIHRLGTCQLETKQYQQARKSYEKTLEFYDALGSEEERQKQRWKASTYHELGRVAQDLREFSEARRNYELALQIKIDFGDRYSCASTYHNLGMVAQDLREFDEARRNYRQALQITIEFGDRYSCARTYHQLGWVAQIWREFSEARRNYELALQIFIDFGERYSCASTYYCLGLLAQAEENYPEARANLQKALEIYVEYKNESSAEVVREDLERLPE